MDPPLVAIQYPTSTAAVMTGTINHHQNVSGLADSTPRSASQAVTNYWQDDLGQLAQVPGGAKLRLMCSYGGHIIPRPHDKSLCYMGGETRMVTVERNFSLSDLSTRLSRSLLDGREGFSLKYQLPNEDLDSLISVATDEDLENMVDEYDRLMAAKPGGGGRLRLFMFLAKPETAKTMGVLLDGVKSETWFVDALNGADVLNRGLSDSAAIDDLLSLGSGVSREPNVATQINHPVDAVEQAKIPPQQDVHSIHSIMPDAPMMETTTSSCDSSTSSPSMAHLPPIRVRVDEGVGGGEMNQGPTMEEQFLSQLRVTPPLPMAILTPPTTVANTTTTITGTISASSSEGNLNRVAVSDDERSDHSVPVVSRKPPLPLPLLHVQQRFNGGFNMMPSTDMKHAGGYDLPSPDSVNSDCSIASSTSLTKAQVHQDSSLQVPTSKPNNDPKLEPSPTTPTPHTTTLQPTQDPNTYLYPPPPPPQQQPQFIQPPNMLYLPAHHTHTPTPPYYPVYQAQHPNHPQVEHQQYPTMYYLPVTQTQPYTITIQPNEPTPSANQAAPPVYPPRPGNHPGGLIQVNPNPPQFHQQIVGYSTTGQPMVASGANYGNYEYGHDSHQQQQQQQQQHLYYTGQISPANTTEGVTVVGSQYQSITPAQAVMLAEASMPLPASDSGNQQLPGTS